MGLMELKKKKAFADVHSFQSLQAGICFLAFSSFLARGISSIFKENSMASSDHSLRPWFLIYIVFSDFDPPASLL